MGENPEDSNDPERSHKIPTHALAETTANNVAKNPNKKRVIFLMARQHIGAVRACHANYTLFYGIKACLLWKKHRRTAIAPPISRTKRKTKSKGRRTDKNESRHCI